MGRKKGKRSSPTAFLPAVIIAAYPGKGEPNLLKQDKKISIREALTVLAVCAFPINIWAIIGILYQVPAWILSNSRWDFIGLIALALTYTLAEILALFLPLLAAGWLAPARWLKGRFVALSTAVVLEVTVFVLLLHFVEGLIWKKRLLAIPFIVILGCLFFLVVRFPKFGRGLEMAAERMTILASIFLFFNLVSVIIVLVRNL